ncbi:MAG: PorT family protein [Alistipes sp.]|jgi:hypothetical protein|nr:PorT family protein [Alistipes sp.]
MKKLVCIAWVLSVVFPLSAQHYIGVKGGYGAARGRITTVWGKREGAMSWDKYTGGIMWRYYTHQKVVGGLQAELEFQSRGYSAYYHVNEFGTETLSSTPIISDTTSYRVKTRTVSSLTLPLIVQPHFYLFDRHVRVFASLGVTLSYNLGVGDTFTVTDFTATRVDDDPAANKYHWEQTSAQIETGPYKMQTARDVRWNYGALGGLGIGVLFDRWEIFAEGRYYYGMSDIMRNDSKHQFNPERMMRSELDNIYITVGVFFRLGKGGIVEPRLRRTRRASTASDNFQNIKLPY